MPLPPRPYHRLSSRAAGFVLSALVAGCTALTQAHVPVGGVDPENQATTARIAVTPNASVLLRAVDGQFLPAMQISSRVRAYTYVLPPGVHTLWLMAAPFGLPFIPQRLQCYVMQVSLSAGARYELDLDSAGEQPRLRHASGAEAEAVGRLVDAPLVLERGCQWP